MSVALVGIGHRYADRADEVLVDVDLELPDGVSAAITGPSGTGKSTLLGIVGALVPPTRGTVLLDSEPLRAGGHQLRRDIAWVHQGSNALLGRTVLENVVLPAIINGGSRAVGARRAERLLAEVGLVDMAERVAGSLSGGELQRACVARALMCDPRLICADEPTGNLDDRSTALVVRALKDAPSRTGVLLVATHDPSVAAACQREYRVGAGRLVRCR